MNTENKIKKSYTIFIPVKNEERFLSYLNNIIKEENDYFMKPPGPYVVRHEHHMSLSDEDFLMLKLCYNLNYVSRTQNSNFPNGYWVEW